MTLPCSGARAHAASLLARLTLTRVFLPGASCAPVCAAPPAGGKPTIVTNAEGARTTPSVVAYGKSGELLVGQIAKRQVRASDCCTRDAVLQKPRLCQDSAAPVAPERAALSGRLAARAHPQ